MVIPIILAGNLIKNVTGGLQNRRLKSAEKQCIQPYPIGTVCVHLQRLSSLL